jgi:hypothetical protein
MKNKLLLLQAERSYVLGQTADAIEKYKSADDSASVYPPTEVSGIPGVPGRGIFAPHYDTMYYATSPI